MGAPARPQRACYGADTVTALDPPQTASLTGTRAHEAPRRSGAPGMLLALSMDAATGLDEPALAEHLAVEGHRVEGLELQKLIVIVRRSRHRNPFVLDPELRQLVMHELRARKQVVLRAADDPNRLLPKFREVLRRERRRRHAR